MKSCEMSLVKLNSFSALDEKKKKGKYLSEKEVKNLQKIISMSKDTKTENSKVCYLIYVQLRKRHSPLY